MSLYENKMMSIIRISSLLFRFKSFNLRANLGNRVDNRQKIFQAMQYSGEHIISQKNCNLAQNSM